MLSSSLTYSVFHACGSVADIDGGTIDTYSALHGSCRCNFFVRYIRVRFFDIEEAPRGHQ
jgi:hypothetical protein